MTASCGNHCSKGLPPQPKDVVDKGRAWLWASAKDGIASRAGPSGVAAGTISAICPFSMEMVTGPEFLYSDPKRAALT